MPKLSSRAPKYAHHKASGQAVVKFAGRLHYLGPYGSSESKARYQEQMVPVEVLQRLEAVDGLAKGRTEARESDPVLPVDDATVDATVTPKWCWVTPGRT